MREKTALGKLIEEIRKKRGMTLLQMAEAMDTTTGLLHSISVGDRECPLSYLEHMRDTIEPPLKVDELRHLWSHREAMVPGQKINLKNRSDSVRIAAFMVATTINNGEMTDEIAEQIAFAINVGLR